MSIFSYEDIPLWIKFVALPTYRDHFVLSGGEWYSLPWFVRDIGESYFKVPRTDEETFVYCFKDYKGAETEETLRIVKETLGRIPKVFYDAFYATSQGRASGVVDMTRIIRKYCGRINKKKFIKIGKELLAKEYAEYSGRERLMVMSCIFGDKVDKIDINHFDCGSFFCALLRKVDVMDKIVHVADLLDFKDLNDMYCIFKLVSLIDDSRTERISMREAHTLIREDLMKNFDLLEECNGNKILANAIEAGMEGGRTSTMEAISNVSIVDGKYSVRVLDKKDPTGVLLGSLTNCCQGVDGAGQSSMIAGYELPESGFLVIEKEEVIVAQAWIYEYTSKSGKKVLVLDNIESLNVKAYEKKLHELLQRFCFKISDIIDEVHLGLGYNDLALGILPVPYNEIQFPKSLVNGTEAILNDDGRFTDRCAAYTDALSRVYLVKNGIVIF